MQTTYIMVKPDGVQRGLVGEIIQRFERKGLKLVGLKQIIPGEKIAREHYAEITFIGIDSAIIKEHKKIGSILNVTVDFIAEVITCIRDKDKKIVSGDPEKIKKIYDTWVFSRDMTSANPNWQLVNTLT